MSQNLMAYFLFEKKEKECLEKSVVVSQKRKK